MKRLSASQNEHLFFQGSCVQTIVKDEDKSHDNQDMNESKEIDSNNQLVHEENITKTGVSDYTVIIKSPKRRF